MLKINPPKTAFDVVTFVPKAIISIPKIIAAHREEIKRRLRLEEERRLTPPSYDDGVSEEEFEQIVLTAKKAIPRIKTASVNGFVVNIEVKSRSGLSIWRATIDFNKFGHLTGWHKIWSENDDSIIPEAFAREVVEGIRLCKEANGYPTSPEDDDREAAVE